MCRYEPEIANKSSSESMRKYNLIQFMEFIGQFDSLSMNTIEMLEDEKGFELVKFYRD